MLHKWVEPKCGVFAMSRIEMRFVWTILGVCVGALAVLLTGGCSTISGAAHFIGGVAADISDAAEGTRERMGSGGSYDGVRRGR